jgi:hypothetical protein
MFYVLYDDTGNITSTIMTDEVLELTESHLVFDADEVQVSSMLANCWGRIKVDTVTEQLTFDQSVDKDYLIQEVLGGLIIPTLLPTKRNISILEKQVDFLIKVVLGLIDNAVDQTHVDALRQVDQHSSLNGRTLANVLDTVVEGKAYLRQIVNMLRDREAVYAPNKASAKTRWLWYLNDNKELLATHELNGLLSFLLETTREITSNELKTQVDGIAQQMSQP